MAARHLRPLPVDAPKLKTVPVESAIANVFAAARLDA
jgi:hypothetical protein